MFATRGLSAFAIGLCMFVIFDAKRQSVLRKQRGNCSKSTAFCINIDFGVLGKIAQQITYDLMCYLAPSSRLFSIHSIYGGADEPQKPSYDSKNRGFLIKKPFLDKKPDTHLPLLLAAVTRFTRTRHAVLRAVRETAPRFVKTVIFALSLSNRC
jgi:hypothetical protein